MNIIVNMGKYAREPVVGTKAAKAKGADLRVHFKNTTEVARVLRGMDLQVAKRYLDDVLNHRRCIPYSRLLKAGRTAQAKEFGLSTGRWPEKSVQHVLSLLKNAEANAETKGLKTDNLVISHIQVNAAAKGRRRTFRAHGSITPYLSSQSHIELFVTEKTEGVKKSDDKKAPVLTKK